MVSSQATQDGNTAHPTDWKPRAEGDSVRITAEGRRAVVKFFTDELARQQTVADFEARDFESKRKRDVPSEHAERRASNATAVLQYIGSTLRAFEGNRDFVGQVTR